MVSLSSLSSPHRGTVPVMILTMNTVASSTDGEHDKADVEEVRDNGMDGIGPTRKRGADYSPELRPDPPKQTPSLLLWTNFSGALGNPFFGDSPLADPLNALLGGRSSVETLDKR
jgi:hypothetical protein